MMRRAKSVVKKTPFLGPAAAFLWHSAMGWRWRISRMMNPPSSSGFRRMELSREEDTNQQSITQIRNLLNYTKRSGASYDGSWYPAGYHAIDIGGIRIPGQRSPRERFDAVPLDWSGKTILDIGCNQGGMLFEIADSLKWGVGIDYDYRLINAANRIRRFRDLQHLDFYVFDLQNEPLDLIEDLLPGPKVDCVFLLSVCLWLNNWRAVVDLAARVGESLLFESNGSETQQQDQVRYLNERYGSVAKLTDMSDDDPRRKSRRMYYCS